MKRNMSSKRFTSLTAGHAKVSGTIVLKGVFNVTCPAYTVENQASDANLFFTYEKLKIKVILYDMFITLDMVIMSSFCLHEKWTMANNKNISEMTRLVCESLKHTNVPHVSQHTIIVWLALAGYGVDTEITLHSF